MIVPFCIDRKRKKQKTTFFGKNIIFREKGYYFAFPLFGHNEGKFKHFTFLS